MTAHLTAPPATPPATPLAIEPAAPTASMLPAASQRSPRKARSDGSQARAQLLSTALRLFSQHGFSKTSTRDIALAAGANIASISYYFGDKAGLYRAVMTEPMGSAVDDIALYNQPQMSLRESLTAFFSSFLEPMQQGEVAQHCMRLHFREMIEPTGLWAEQIDHDILPAHAALAEVLARHLGLSPSPTSGQAQADDDLHRLTFSVAGLAVQMFVCRDVVDAIAPQLLARPEAIDTWSARLVDYAEAMVAVELKRRQIKAAPAVQALAPSASAPSESAA